MTGGTAEIWKRKKKKKKKTIIVKTPSCVSLHLPLRSNTFTFKLNNI